jgi:hypothetical protein
MPKIQGVSDVVLIRNARVGQIKLSVSACLTTTRLRCIVAKYPS